MVFHQWVRLVTQNDKWGNSRQQGLHKTYWMTHPKLLFAFREEKERERDTKILLSQGWDRGSGCVLQNKTITWNGCLGTYLTSSYSPISLDRVKDKIAWILYL